jgi:ubiquinol-cytochrome c reductase cytochrome b subunit
VRPDEDAPLTLFPRTRRWLRDRLGLDALQAFFLDHKVPAAVVGRQGWMYVLGVSILAVLGMQVVTGVALATKYVPSTAHAYDSLHVINTEVSLGWLVRGMHYYGASAMVTLVALHMARVYLMGAYKFPREMGWISGVVLAFLTMGMAYTGQLLRWDNDGIWSVLVGMKFIERVPFVGRWLAEFLLAGDHLGGATLTRFFALHVLIFPLLIFASVGLHLFLVIHNGISEPPVAGRPVDPRTYRAYYARLKAQGGRYWPDSAWREVLAGVLVIAFVIALAAVFGPKGPGQPPDPTLLQTNPHPDWFLVWYFAILYFKPRGLETLVMVYAPLAALVGLIVFPIIARKGERSPLRRPWASAIVLGSFIGLFYLIWIGLQAPWTPPLTLQPLEGPIIERLSGEPAEGARLVVERGCLYCHKVLNQGTGYGPDLTGVAARLSPEVISSRIVAGFGDMPAYRDVLDERELSALLAFFRELLAQQ